MMTIKANDKVTYQSTGRPWLRNRTGVVQQVSSTGASALVTFPATGSYNTASEWIGVTSLSKAEVTSNVSTARKAVQDKIRAYEKQISDLRSKISKLNYANKALKDLETEV